jgi:xylan 1,4-beta-xylosidase
MQVSNPILPGFHPDPSIVRHGEDYYIATSSFQWFPGLRIHHSKDLVNWHLLGSPLDRKSQLDLTSVPDSGGVWAPCLSVDPATGTFYLIYSIVRSRPAYLSDVVNLLVTASDPAGPWSDPIVLNGRGFDASLYHGEDGTKWLLQMQWDHRPGRNGFSGVLLQQYDPSAQQLVGKPRLIFEGSPLGCTEGPHIYKRNGWYYLMTAEGGTSYDHAVTIARSRDIAGPYTIHPGNPILTSVDQPNAPLQKAGHASLVQTPNDEWYMPHLCARPLPETRRCILGRETAIQKIVWDEDGWPRLEGGGQTPGLVVPAPTGVKMQLPNRVPTTVSFGGPGLDSRLNTLRQPPDPSWLSLSERTGWLRLRGGASPQSLREQSLVGLRVQDMRCQARVRIEFAPDHFQQMAGLMAYYDTKCHYYLHVTHDEHVGRCLYLIVSDQGKLSSPLTAPVPIGEGLPCYLRADLDHSDLTFSHSTDGRDWRKIGPVLDSSILSDDYCPGLGFTGMFFALAAQDLTGDGLHADFTELIYRPEQAWSQTPRIEAVPKTRRSFTSPRVP